MIDVKPEQIKVEKFLSTRCCLQVKSLKRRFKILNSIVIVHEFSCHQIAGNIEKLVDGSDCNTSLIFYSNIPTSRMNVYIFFTYLNFEEAVFKIAF